MTKRNMKTDNGVKEVINEVIKDDCRHWMGLCALSKGLCHSCITYALKTENDDPFPLMFKEIPILKENILKIQNGRCNICGKEIILQEACLDHSHQKKNKGSGKCRGIVCSFCNNALGNIENRAPRWKVSNTEISNFLLKMVTYLNTPHYNYLHPTERPKSPKLRKDCYNKLVKLIKKSKVKCKIPAYTGNCTKPLMILFNKYKITPEFYK